MARRKDTNLSEILARQLENVITEEKIRRGGLDRGEVIQHLADEIGVVKSTVYNWLNPKTGNIGEIGNLIRLASVTKTSLDTLFETGVDYQDRINVEQNVLAKLGEDEFEHLRDELIANTKRELWIQARTGGMFHAANSSASDALSHARQSMQPEKLTVRILVPNPGNPKGRKNYPYQKDCALSMVALRRREQHDDNEVASNAIKDFLKLMKSAAIAANSVDQLIIRTTHYPPAHLVFISDPPLDQNRLHETDGNGRAIVLLFNFRVDTPNSPMIYVTENSDKPLFDFFCEDYIRQWNFGKDYNL